MKPQQNNRPRGKTSMKRRTFIGLGLGAAVAGISGATALTPLVEPDVRGWRFGVWIITGRYGVRHGQNYYWCRCDCGAERVVGLNQLLSVDALSCAHVRHGGFFSINPDAVICQNCGENRRFFFNGDGLRIWRCGNCERKDIMAYLRREYGEASSIQFTANMKKANAKK